MKIPFITKLIKKMIFFLDANADGILSWEDFKLLAEKFARIQRRGKLEQEVLDRWKSIFEKWWNELTSCADYNKVHHTLAK